MSKLPTSGRGGEGSRGEGSRGEGRGGEERGGEGKQKDSNALNISQFLSKINHILKMKWNRPNLIYTLGGFC